MYIIYRSLIRLHLEWVEEDDGCVTDLDVVAYLEKNCVSCVGGYIYAGISPLGVNGGRGNGCRPGPIGPENCHAIDSQSTQ